MKRWVWVVAILVIVVAVVAKFTMYSEMPDKKVVGGDEKWCNHDWPDSAKVIQIGDFTNVPEFNDCQRFVVDSAGTYVYDSLFAIFVSPKLDSIEQRLGPAVPAPPGVLVRAGTLVAVPASGASTVSTLSTQFIANLNAVMVAVVFAGGPYAPLGIQTNLNCLYVWRILNQGPPPSETWFARMVPKGNANSCPDTTQANIGTGKDLQVSRSQVGGFTAESDYPRVTRWDWDETNKKQYVGIGCGAAWCEIYDTALSSSPPLPTDGSDPVGVRRVRLIKGWYDQQLLATVDASGRLVPSGVLGTIVPDPDLANITADKFEHDFVHVADISLTSSIAGDPVVKQYESKFNFIRTPITNPVTLSLKGKQGEADWKSRIQKPGMFGILTRKYKHITRRVMPGAASTQLYDPLATARWRWLSYDEGTWTRCTAGCCEMKP